MKRCTLTTLLFSCFFATLGVAAPEDGPDLKLKSIEAATTGEELSGIFPAPKGLWGVADDEGDPYLYMVEPAKDKNRYLLTKAVDLTKLKGFSDVMAAIKAETRVGEKHRRLDLEGVTACGDKVYIANERVRQVMIVDLNAKSIAKAPIDFSSYKSLFEGEANAGFEGIAADCATQTLYVAKERDPRAILIVDMATWTYKTNFDLPLSSHEGQKVINPADGKSMLYVGPDFADLMFDNGYLYALERNAHFVAKVDPKTVQVVQRVGYFLAEHGLYETGEPYGESEGLVLTKDEVVIAIDNNGNPFTHWAEKERSLKGNSSAIMRFERPAGF